MDSDELISKLSFWKRNKLPTKRQSESAECGLTCLAMIAEYHGYATDLISLRRKFRLSLNGATLHDIMQFAEVLHLTSRPLRIEIEDLKNLKTPCILHWNLNHFVVLESANDKKVVIHDPAIGKKRLNMSEVSMQFTGIALELSPTSSFEKKEAKDTLKLSDFWTKITGLKKSLILVFSLSVLLQIFALASPYYVQLVIDDVILSGDISLLTVLAVGFTLVLIFEVSTNALRGLTLLHFSNLMNLQLGANLFHHLVRLPIEYFEKRHIGDIVSRFGSLQQIRQLLTVGITEALIDGIMALITLAMIFFYSAKLSLVVLLAVLLYALLRLATYSSFRNISEQEIITSAEENSSFMETIRGIQTIKLFGSEAKREGLWQNCYANSINQSIRLGNFQISFAAANRTLFGIESIVVVYLAAKLVIAGGFSTGMLFAFIAYKQQFIGKVNSLIEKLIEFKMLGLHFERLGDIALTDKEDLETNNEKYISINGSIRLEGVCFSYSDATPNVIDNASLEIRAGESVVITGTSGCGKTTLLKIMLGIVLPQKGKVYIDNTPLNQISKSNYRRQVATVMQNDQLLSGSIADNIAFFDDSVDIEKVKKCAQLAAIHDVIIKMPMGYDSYIGDMGSSLSGGQKQRIMLARALYKNPKILFMDEATSHLDAELEADINEAIKKIDITRVIIAHRKETIMSADREIKIK